MLYYAKHHKINLTFHQFILSIRAHRPSYDPNNSLWYKKCNQTNPQKPELLTIILVISANIKFMNISVHSYLFSVLKLSSILLKWVCKG